MRISVLLVAQRWNTARLSLRDESEADLAEQRSVRVSPVLARLAPGAWRLLASGDSEGRLPCLDYSRGTLAPFTQLKLGAANPPAPRAGSESREPQARARAEASALAQPRRPVTVTGNLTTKGSAEALA